MNNNKRNNHDNEGSRVSKGDDYSRAISRELFSGTNSHAAKTRYDGSREDDDNMLSISDFIQPKKNKSKNPLDRR